MRHLLLAGSVSEGDRQVFVSRQHHYLARVLRLKPGDRVDAIDAGGNSCIVVIDHLDDTTTHGHIAKVGVSGQPGDVAAAFPPITLYQALPKGRKLDDVVRYATQAGVSRIVPIMTERVVVRLDGGLGSRLERLRRVATEAVQQSGAPQPVQINDAIDLDSVQPAPGHLALVLTPGPLAHQSLHGYLSEVPHGIELCVGPEGGLSESEVERLQNAGFQPLTLGPQILRTEVAAFYATAAIRTLLLEHDWWRLKQTQ